MTREFQLIALQPRRRATYFDRVQLTRNSKPQGLPLVKGAPTDVQRAYLSRGLGEPGGKLPLFTTDGARIDPKTIRTCISHGWAEPWHANPLKPDWLVCKLTAKGRAVLAPAVAAE